MDCLQEWLPKKFRMKSLSIIIFHKLQKVPEKNLHWDELTLNQFLKILQILRDKNLHSKMIVNRVENSNHQIKKADMNDFHHHWPVSIRSKRNLTLVFDFHYKVQDSEKINKIFIISANIMINHHIFFHTSSHLTEKKKLAKKIIWTSRLISYLMEHYFYFWFITTNYHIKYSFIGELKF